MSPPTATFLTIAAGGGTAASNPALRVWLWPDRRHNLSMRSLKPDRVRRTRALSALCAAVALAVAACSGGSPPDHPASPAASTDPATGPAAAAAVKAMWERFFDGTVPISSRLQLLQDIPKFAPFVH